MFGPTPTLLHRMAAVAVIACVVMTAATGCAVGRRLHESTPPASAQGPVLFATSFESPTWFWDWGSSRGEPNADTVAVDDALRFRPLAGRALRIRIAEGKHVGASLVFEFAKRLGEEPDEVYLRYYLRLANDWRPTSSGKLPGLAGTYDRAGWGRRRADGTNGWSARGLFSKAAEDRTPLGFYVYHPDMKGVVGSAWHWTGSKGAALERNRWYCIEQHVKLNEPGQSNGVLQAWVDDALVFEKTDVRYRDVDDLHIDRVWIDVYHGGQKVAAADHHLYIDELVVSRRPIGPHK